MPTSNFSSIAPSVKRWMTTEMSTTIYRISDELRERIDLISWRDLGNQLERIAVVPTTAVTFDATNRRAISAEVFERFEPRRTKD